jgi:hypothetical protein
MRRYEISSVVPARAEQIYDALAEHAEAPAACAAAEDPTDLRGPPPVRGQFGGGPGQVMDAPSKQPHP